MLQVRYTLHPIPYPYHRPHHLPQPHLLLLHRRPRSPPQHQPRNPRRHISSHRRPHRLRQIHPRRPHPPPPRRKPGQILIDNQPIRDTPCTTSAHPSAFVPQETFLFSDTIAQNIAFGVPNATPAQIEEAATTAHIATEILEFPPRLRNPSRRARHHPLRRPEATHLHRPRGHPQPSHPHPRRRPRLGRHLHRRAHPLRPPRSHARAAPPSSSPTASPPPATPTRSRSSSPAASPNKGPTTN